MTSSDLIRWGGLARPGKALFPTVSRPDVTGADLREMADRIVVAEGR